MEKRADNFMVDDGFHESCNGAMWKGNDFVIVDGHWWADQHNTPTLLISSSLSTRFVLENQAVVTCVSV